jgi:hypothetical protein
MLVLRLLPNSNNTAAITVGGANDAGAQKLNRIELSETQWKNPAGTVWCRN